jgi:hypothetical protein
VQAQARAAPAQLQAQLYVILEASGPALELAPSAERATDPEGARAREPCAATWR